MPVLGKDLVSQYYLEVINGHDFDAITKFFSNERLIEGIRRGCMVLFKSFPDLHSSIEEMVAEGDRIVCHALSTGTHDGEWMGIPATGRHITFEYAEGYRIGDGVFVGYWCVPDMAGLMRQLTAESPAGTVA
ncbi:hypothetical protein BH18ACT5_BH18ACT5_16190 [soil metagenome]